MFVALVDESLGFNKSTTVTFMQYNGNEKAIQLLNDLIDKIGDDAFDHSKDDGGSDFDRYTLNINKLIPEEHIDILFKYSFGETYYKKCTGTMKTDDITSVLKKVRMIHNDDDDDDEDEDLDEEDVYREYEYCMMDIHTLFTTN